MTSRERVLTSRLISKIEKNKKFADDVGLSYTIREVDMSASSSRQAQYQNLGKNEKSEEL